MRWWEKAEKEPQRDLKLTLDELNDDHERLETQYRTWLGLYTNRTFSSFKPGEAHFAIHLLEEQFGVKLNVVQSCIDTLASKIGASRPRPQFLTSDGEWDLKQRAKKLDKFVEGIFYECKIYEEARKVFIDAAVFGTGFLKIFEHDSRIRLERVFPSEMVVDQQSTVTADPRAMYQKKWVPLEVLKRAYPKRKDELSLIAGETIIEGTKSIDTDLVQVTEAWHLPSGEGAKDGRHVICTDEICLFDEAWEFDYFPFVCLRWTPQPFGWLGQGLSEQLAGIQQEIDKLIRRVQNAMHLFSVAKVVMEEGAIEPKKLRNVTGDILEYKTGKNPPTVHMPSAINNEVFRHLWQLYEKAYEISGISQMSAASRKPADVESGIAIQTLLDIETQWFALLSKDWEEFFCEAARIVVDLSKKINSRTKFRSRWVAKDFVETIDWGDVNLRRDQYVLKVYPANLLPTTPYGRLAAVENLMRIGLISDPREAMALLDYPDLAKHQTLAAADIDDIDMVIGEILGKGNYIEPEPYQNLDIGMKRISSALLRARIDRAPEDRILMLEQWLEDAERLIEVKEQEMQAEMAQQEQMMAQQQALEQGPPPAPGGPPEGMAPPPLPGEEVV
jgi:hypothetical protein